MEKYPVGLEFDNIEPLEDYEGEPHHKVKGEVVEKMVDDELDSSNQKCPRESDYEVDDEDSEARSHPTLKMPKQYIIISKEEDYESGKL